jgi:hypothetical protein
MYGMVLFLQNLFNIWYKSGLLSLILCKQLVHMYDVELIFIWIWSYIKGYFNNWFEKTFTLLELLVK